MSSEQSMDEFKRQRVIEACKTLCVALLAQQDGENIDGTVPIFMMGTLNEEQRGLVAEIFLRSFPADQAEAICQDVFKGAGWPKPCLMTEANSDARHWVKSANAVEQRAYTMALVEHMHQDQLKRFYDYVGDKINGGKKS